MELKADGIYFRNWDGSLKREYGFVVLKKAKKGEGVPTVDSVMDALYALSLRLTTLEAARDNAQWRLSHLECPSKWTLQTEDRLTALEAKVDTPKYVHCYECAKDFSCKLSDDPTRDFCTEGVKQPPDTCGNCKKAWRRDRDRGLVLCDIEMKNWHRVHYGEPPSPQYKANGKPACPHHERREA